MENLLRKETDYFLKNRQSLAAEHKGKFIVIAGNDVLGAYETPFLAIDAMHDKGMKAGMYLIREAVETDEQIVFKARVVLG